MQGRVDVEGHEPDEREVKAERGDQPDEQACHVSARLHRRGDLAADLCELLTHPGGEDHEQAARRHRAEVERRPG